MWLELSAVTRRFGARIAVNQLSLGLERGSIGCLLGPSGCGKTTALRCIAGFEPVDEGSISADGRVLSRPGWQLPPQQRHIGMVFQDYALFAHLTVEQNVAFGLHRLDHAQRAQRTEHMLASVGLLEHRRQYPYQLSGGQQQRVALARALAPEPAIVLLDEPFSSLDVELRERLGVQVRDLLKQLQATALLVTHDQNEAFAVADHVGVMRDGQLEQWSTPHELYHRPASRFVADFIGQGVFVPGRMLGPGRVQTGFGEVQGGSAAIATDAHQGQDVELLLRPDDVVHDERSELRATVCHRAFRGADYLYTLLLPGEIQVLCLIPSHREFALGERIGVRVQPDHLVVFPRA